ncbi:MAG: amidohydrolase family protein [Myxococcota bacterium]|nr:amidohydrolase family protein [Myxococcota bacterium]
MRDASTLRHRIREQLDHPVIDADGHLIEFGPALAGFLAEEGIGDPGRLFRDISCGAGTPGIDTMTPRERDAVRAVRVPWWATPASNTLDLATAMLPELLYERLDDLGIDFAVLYGSAALLFPHARDEATRRGACRAANRYFAELFGTFSDRMTPAAVVPLHTPEEGIELLEHAVGELGLKTAMIPSFVERAVPDGHRAPYNVWFDTLGLDSAYDYDPFWQRCIDLGVSVASHSPSMGIGFRSSPTNYMHNHIGHFAAAGEALAKSLLFGGVTSRFPKLRVAFLEGGVHWAVGLLGDFVGRWGKRNRQAVRTYDPARVDRAKLAGLFEKYGGRLIARAPGGLAELGASELSSGPFDDFEHVAAASEQELGDRFVPNFYFGCEADDPMTATAFDTERTPFGRPLHAMFSSDIGHWDVPDMTDVLDEAWEHVERGWLDRPAFRDFVFSNAVRFYTDTNPDFFAGTVVEKAVAAERPELAVPQGRGA